MPIFKSDVACALRYTGYEHVATALGAHGLRVDTEAELPGTLEEAKRLTTGADGKPVCVNVMLGYSSFREGSISV